MLLTLQLGAGGRGALRVALAALVAADEQLIRRGGLPRLYASGVRYQRERPDVWSTADVAYRRKTADCEDLAAWRTAELRVLDGEPAHADAYSVGPGKWHAVVRRADGRIEDPSRVLGMGKRR